MAAPQPITAGYQPGRTIFARIVNPLTGLYWNNSTLAFEAFNGASADQKRALADANGIGFYSVAFPTQITGIIVQVLVYDSADTTNPIGVTQIDSSNTPPGGPSQFSPSVVAVVNRALGLLGVPKITALNDGSEAADRASDIFDTIRTSLLREHYWKFADYTDTLAALANELLIDWDFLYVYPAKCLMIRRIFDQSCMNPGGDFIFDFPFFGELWLFHHPEFRYKEALSPSTFTKSIAANVNPAYIEYTYDVEDPAQWDSAFTDAMVYKLAAELAHPLTGSTDLMKGFRADAVAIVSEAKRLDAQEDNSTRKQTSTYQRSRM